MWTRMCRGRLSAGPTFTSLVVFEERPLRDREAGLELLGLEVAVDAGDDGDDAAHDAARCEAEDPEDQGRDALHLLADHEVTDAADHQKVEHQDDDRILRWLLRINEITATARCGRRRRCGCAAAHVGLLRASRRSR